MDPFNWNFVKLHPTCCCNNLVEFQISVVLFLLVINNSTLTYFKILRLRKKWHATTYFDQFILPCMCDNHDQVSAHVCNSAYRENTKLHWRPETNYIHTLRFVNRQNLFKQWTFHIFANYYKHPVYLRQPLGSLGSLYKSVCQNYLKLSKCHLWHNFICTHLISM